LHAATVVAVVIYFRKTILKLNLDYLKYIVIGTIPAVIIGFLFKDFIEGLFSNIKFIGFAFLLTALLNYLTSKIKEGNKDLNVKNSLFIGIFQAIAIIPGVSRSGSTIFAGTRSGINKLKAAQFSFLLSVPAVLGANLLEIVTLKSGYQINIPYYAAGFIAALISGYLAIALVFRFIKTGRFGIFAVYSLILGLLTLLLL
jgi:undecaprenyl-diphosphatase